MSTHYTDVVADWYNTYANNNTKIAAIAMQYRGIWKMMIYVNHNISYYGVYNTGRPDVLCSVLRLDRHKTKTGKDERI